MKLDAEALYQLLPAVYRARDAEQGLPLHSFLDVLTLPLVIVSENIDQLYDDLFIETCAEWAVPYIGDLIGATGLNRSPDAKFSQRAQVARTLAYRRRKGTAAVIEDLARDVTNWRARVVEFFQLLAVTQNLNHQRLDPPTFVNLHSPERLELLNTPFASAAHLAEVRPMARGGRYNIPNIGIYLHRVDACALVDVDPSQPFADFRYRFNPLGADLALYNNPVNEESVNHIAQPDNVARPLERLSFKRGLAKYLGPQFSLWIIENNTLLGLDDVLAADLSDRRDGSWGPRHATRYKIDPVLGRFLAPQDADAPKLTVGFHTGCLTPFGGGSYDRSGTLNVCQDPAAPRLPLTPVTRVDKNLQAAIDAKTGSRVIEIQDSATYPGAITLNAGAAECIEFRAADGQRPYIAGDLTVTGAPNSTIVLSGLLIGGQVQVPAGSGGPSSLILLHCTLVPGQPLDGAVNPTRPGTPSLFIHEPNTVVEVQECILGGIRTENDVRFKIRGSVVDANAAEKVALAAPDNQSAAGILTMQNTTIIGKIHVRQMDEATDTIFLAEPGGSDPWPSSAALLVDRIQEGCVRFSYVPPGARVPRRYACQPSGVRADQVRPVFVSLRYGSATYAQLSRTCPPEIARGADDESEMGVFHDLHQPQRESNLRALLEEYLRIGLEAEIFYAR